MDRHIWNWVRWGKRKWHLLSESPARPETICGTIIKHDFQRFESHFVPEDDEDVCLHCLRYRERKLRQQ